MRSLMMALIALMGLAFAAAPAAMADENKPAAPAAAEKSDAGMKAEHKEMKKERKHHMKKHHVKHHAKKHEKKMEKKEMKKGEEGK
jgi:hypothetical protein